MRIALLALALVSTPAVADLTGLAVPPMELAVSVSADGDRSWRLIIGWKEAKLRRSVPDVDAFVNANASRLLAEKKECPNGWEIVRRESMKYALIVHGRCR